MKKALKIGGIVILILIVAAIALPMVFKGKIMTIAKRELNNNLNARTDFKDVDISFFRSFPRLAVGLEALQITGIDHFAKDTLISAGQIDVAVNIFSLFNTSNIRVYKVTLDNPRIHAIVDEYGRANWDIVKPSAEEETSSDTSKTEFNLDLKKYEINNGYLEYRDVPGKMYAEIRGLNHEGSGDLGADIFTLSTKTRTESVNFSYEGIPYLNNTVTGIDGDFEINTATSTYSFEKTAISLNDLKISGDGFFKIVNDSTYGMDIRFDAPSADFKSILSLIPAVYSREFSKIETKGTALFNGFVKGEYNPQKLPAYKLNLEVKDGYFKYPDLPKPVKNINLVMHVDNPDGVMDNTVVDIPQGHIEMDNTPFDFRVLFKKPETDRYIDAAAKGRLDLSQLGEFVKLESATKLSGILDADVQAKGNLAVIQQQKPGEFSARGYIDVSKLFYSSSAFPQPVQNTSAKIIIDNPDGVADHTTVQIPAAHVEVGNDKADLTLFVKNPATDPVFNGTAKGGLNLSTVKQFYTFEEGTSLGGTVNADVSFNGRKSFIDKEAYDKVQVSGSVLATDITYKTKEYKDGLKLARVAMNFNPGRLTINETRGSFEQTNFTADGSVDNYIGYALKDEPVSGTLNLNADRIDLNKWMGGGTTDSEQSSTSATPFEVPANINFTVNAKAAQLHYDKVDYNNLAASLQVRDEAILLKNVSLNALDGTIGLSGLYSTRDNKLKPTISLTYDVKGVDIQKTFNAFNTVQVLMPVGKFIAGKLNSQLKLNGSLTSDMMPDLSSVTGSGNLLLLEGFLKKFGPMDKLASTLKIKELENISLKDVKTYFAVNNGKVLVKPFHVKVNNIDMEIGGLHGLDQSIDYLINITAPRSVIGSEANALVENLAKQASSAGLPVKMSETINFKVNMGGSISNPQLKVNLKESTQSMAEELKKQTEDFVKAKVDTVKQAVKDTVTAIKDQLLKDAQREIAKQLGVKDSTDSSKGITLDSSKKKIEEAGKGLLKNILKKKPADSAKRN